MVTDFDGYPVKEGDPVAAWSDGEKFMATVKAIGEPFRASMAPDVWSSSGMTTARRLKRTPTRCMSTSATM
jgi:hypothetical protein